MSAFIIYNQTTGVISGAYNIGAVADIPSVMAANTPAGTSALAVDPTEPVMTDQRGWQVQAGALVAVAPSNAELLAVAQTTQLGILTAAYNAASTANVVYMGTTFMADKDSQQKFAHALLVYSAVGATPDDFYAVDAGYNKVPMSLDQLKGLTVAIAAQVWTAFQRWVDVREALAAATTVAEVQSATW